MSKNGKTPIFWGCWKIIEKFPMTCKNGSFCKNSRTDDSPKLPEKKAFRSHRFKMFRKATSFAKYGRLTKNFPTAMNKYWPYSYPYTLHQLSNYHRFHNKYKQIWICNIYIYIMYIYYYCHTMSYIYVYIYMCIYIYIYVYVFVCIYIYMYVYIMFSWSTVPLLPKFSGHVHQRVAQESRDEALSIEGLEPGKAARHPLVR